MCGKYDNTYICMKIVKILMVFSQYSIFECVLLCCSPTFPSGAGQSTSIQNQFPLTCKMSDLHTSKQVRLEKDSLKIQSTGSYWTNNLFKWLYASLIS